MNKILIEEQNSIITDFLSRPIISREEEPETNPKAVDNLYRSYVPTDIDVFRNRVSELIEKRDNNTIDKVEDKLLSNVEEHLTELIKTDINSQT